MTDRHPAGAGDVVAYAARTLADIDRQIAARHDEQADAGPEGFAVGAVRWSELDGDVVARLAAGDVLATNRDLTQRSLREFLR